jgi:hypothetical protein
MDAKGSAETNDRGVRSLKFFRVLGATPFFASRLFAVALAGVLPPFDKPGPLVLVGGSARANLMTVGPWVSSSTAGSRTRQG